MDESKTILEETKDIYYYLEKNRREAQRPPIERLDYFFEDVNRNTRRFVEVPPRPEPEHFPIEQPKRYMETLLDRVTKWGLLVAVIYILWLLV